MNTWNLTSTGVKILDSSSVLSFLLGFPETKAEVFHIIDYMISQSSGTIGDNQIHSSLRRKYVSIMCIVQQKGCGSGEIFEWPVWNKLWLKRWPIQFIQSGWNSQMLDIQNGITIKSNAKMKLNMQITMLQWYRSYNDIVELIKVCKGWDPVSVNMCQQCHSALDRQVSLHKLTQIWY